MLMQVASLISLAAGVPTSVPVVNPGNAPATVTVELFHGTIEGEALVLGSRVQALVSPAAFALAPHEAQTIRILLKERPKAGTVLRLVTTYTPTSPHEAEDTTRYAARLTIVTRLITKVVVQ